MKKLFILVPVITLLAAACSQQPAVQSNQQVNNQQQLITIPDGRLRVDSPKEGDVLDKTFTVIGFAQDWFEGNISIEVFDGSQNSLFKGNATAADNYGKPGAFKQEIILSSMPKTEVGRIEFNDYSAKDGSLVYQKLLAIKFKPEIVTSGQTTKVKVYFAPKDSQQDQCNDVVAVERTVSQTAKIATAAIEELFKGPTPEEKAKGYTTVLPVGSKLNSLVIVNGEARADFNSVTESGGGSCGMGVRTSQISKTLLQFPTIKTVKFSIDGRTQDIFQP